MNAVPCESGLLYGGLSLRALDELMALAQQRREIGHLLDYFPVVREELIKMG
jgi:alkylation response protein AidB-like acyl-CoA dehydrogenase